MKTPYVILLRGINVGGKNKVTMSDLANSLEELGFDSVETYIASGNVILDSDNAPEEIKSKIEIMLPEKFKLEDELIKVLVLSKRQFQSVIQHKPAGFGDEPDKYHSDAIFLLDMEVSQAMRVFDPREGVDKVWAGEGVIYSQRLSALRTKSRLIKAISTPEYKSMTIRSWNTIIKLMEIMNQRM